MMTATITQLHWERIGRDLTAFGARIDAEEGLLIEFDPMQRSGYEWRLYIISLPRGQKVFLHGHPDLETAKMAAERHIGDE